MKKNLYSSIPLVFVFLVTGGVFMALKRFGYEVDPINLFMYVFALLVGTGIILIAWIKNHQTLRSIRELAEESKIMKEACGSMTEYVICTSRFYLMSNTSLYLDKNGEITNDLWGAKPYSSIILAALKLFSILHKYPNADIGFRRTCDY